MAARHIACIEEALEKSPAVARRPVVGADMRLLGPLQIDRKQNDVTSGKNVGPVVIPFTGAKPR